MQILWFLLGCIGGAVVAWMVISSRIQVARTESTRLRDTLAERDRALAFREQELAEQRREAATAREGVAALGARLEAADGQIQKLSEVEKNLKESFSALASEALRTNSKHLLDLAKGQLEKQQVESASDLKAKESAIENLLKPMQESLAKLSTHSQDLEVKREGAYREVLNEIQNMKGSHADLRRETAQLVAALRAPKVRGNWGEMQLRRCVEYAGMVQYASFEVEKFVKGEDASIKPDLVVKLPNGRSIIVDAKTPLDAFLEASACEDETSRGAHLAAHASQVRKHLDSLCSKAYWKQFPESPDFVVCFLPSEVLFSAALEQDPTLLEYSAESRVLLATPTTLIALLKAVAYGWKQSQIARDAALIRDEALKVQKKLVGLHDAIVDLGKRLKGAVGAYNDMLVKAEGQGGLFSISERLRKLEIGEEELSAREPVEAQIRPTMSDGWQAKLSLVAAEADSEDITE
jgi:DNA recombination protein RmuC